MAKELGFARYTCDRNNSHTAYAQDGSAQANSWHQIERVTQDGVTQAWLLCDECYRKYKSLAAQQDSDFNGFMSEGTERKA